jgi:hypothetical protein
MQKPILSPSDNPLLHEARSHFPNLNWECDPVSCRATIPTLRGGNVPLQIIISYNRKRLAYEARVSVEDIDLFQTNNRPRSTAAQALAEVRSFLNDWAGMIVGA